MTSSGASAPHVLHQPAVRCPAAKWAIAASERLTLPWTHLLLGPAPESGSPGTDKLSLGKSEATGAGRLQAESAALGLRRALSSRCRRGRGSSVDPWTLGWRRSQYGTEQGLAADDWREAAVRLNTAVSGISKAC